MAQFGLFPSFVQINYHSPRGPHIATVPMKQWSAGVDQGFVEDWVSTLTNADTMIQEFVDGYAFLFPDNTVFDYYTIFNYEDEESDPVPVAFNTLTQLGATAVGSNIWVAVQQTVTFQCEGGHILKIVGMDAIAGTQFLPVGPTVIAAALPDLVAALTSTVNGWASRAGSMPLFGKQIAYTINEKLRKQYKLN